MDSDTDPESDYDVPSVALPDSSDFIRRSALSLHHSATTNISALHDRAREAILFLVGLDIDSVSQSTNDHGDIQTASTTLISILHHLARHDKPADVHQILSMMIHDEFLSLLFKYRLVFHRIAARAGSAASCMNICWVDVFLARMVDLIAAVAANTTFWSPLTSRTRGTLTKLQEDSIIRTVAQLPYEWDAVPIVLVSDQSSPLLRRLALHLVFAAYILQPSFSGGCMRGDMLDVSQMSSLVNIYGRRHTESQPKAPCSGRSLANFDLDGDDKVSCAMVVILYSVWASGNSIPQNGPSASPRPYMQSLLLHLIHSILDTGGHSIVSCVLSPRRTLDMAQTIICRWSHVPSWCWRTWDDPRFAEVETISLFTAFWLLHSDRRHVLEELSRESRCAEIHLMQLLHHAVLGMSMNEQGTNNLVLQVLQKICWAVTQLLNPLHSWSVPASSELTRHLCIVLLFCDDSRQELDVKDAIIESLTFAQHDIIEGALRAIFDNPQAKGASLKAKFDNMLVRARRRVMVTANLGGLPLTSHDSRAVHLVLSFCTIIGCTGAPNPAHRSTLSPFLSALTDHIVAKSVSASSLVGPFLHCLSSSGFRGCSTDGYFLRIWDAHVWTVRGCDRVHLLSTSALACHVLATTTMDPMTPLVGIEIWDNIRDVFMLTLTAQYPADDEPLALLNAPTLCLALCTILRHGDPHLVRWASSSPWTGSMCAQLQKLLGCDETKPSIASRVLKEQIALPAHTLVKLIERKALNPDAECTMRLPKAVNKMMYYQTGRFSYIVLIPQIIP